MRSRMKRPVIFAMGIYLLAMTGCTWIMKPPPPTAETALVPVQADDFPVLNDDLNYDGLAAAVSQSLVYLARVSPDRRFQYGPDTYTAAHVIRSLNVFLEKIREKPSAAALTVLLRTKYRIYRSLGKNESGEVLFTGYYEPILRGSRVRQGRYQYPVYGRPKDLITVDLGRFKDKYQGERLVGRVTGGALIPYYDRQQIDEKDALKGKAPVLAWVDDPVALFFLHIQGSGKIYLDNGDYVNAYYHVTNGQPYRSIGRLLIDEGAILQKDMSMQAIRAYLNAHPGQMQRIFNHNPSYVFFKARENGPFGYLNVPLTAGRSLATDRRLFPPAALALVQCQKPVVDDKGKIQRWIPFSRFVLNQDTGGAIRGAARADIFWGNGAYARIAAGHLQHPGTFYFFVLKADE
ncbi:MAG: murein transglycosylase [Deltaproteobacteria bacterium]|nr:MAG: murein transglycosylase [Deltaproteobacteria bacterium]